MNVPEPTEAPCPRSAPSDASSRLHVAGMYPDELRLWFESVGQPGYRATQVLEWIYRHGATSFAQMTNLPKALRDQLEQSLSIYTGKVTHTQRSADGTCKVVILFSDGAAVETVWIPDPPRQTVCLSTQVGCAMGCRFCASGLGGLQRSLTAGEIVEQALHVRALVRRTLNDPQARISNVVFMGMGEPLANYAAVLKAIRILNAPQGMGIGARKITVSTVGLPKQIRRLAEEDLQINLALSLHAADGSLRRKLIPRGHFPLAELLSACRYYFERTGREITLEYVLLGGVNDTPEQADKLAAIARKLRANVNLLRYNPVAGLPFARPGAEATFEFQQRLRKKGVNVHVRSSRGADIDAACGQLRRRAAALGGGPDAPATPPGNEPSAPAGKTL